jgi:hypothetical protein
MSRKELLGVRGETSDLLVDWVSTVYGKQRTPLTNNKQIAKTHCIFVNKVSNIQQYVSRNR